MLRWQGAGALSMAGQGEPSHLLAELRHLGEPLFVDDGWRFDHDPDRVALCVERVEPDVKFQRALPRFGQAMLDFGDYRLRLRGVAAQNERLLGGLHGLRQQLDDLQRIVGADHQVGACQAGVGRREGRVFLHGLLEVPDRCLVALG